MLTSPYIQYYSDWIEQCCVCNILALFYFIFIVSAAVIFSLKFTWTTTAVSNHPYRLILPLVQQVRDAFRSTLEGTKCLCRKEPTAPAQAQEAPISNKQSVE